MSKRNPESARLIAISYHQATDEELAYQNTPMEHIGFHIWKDRQRRVIELTYSRRKGKWIYGRRRPMTLADITGSVIQLEDVYIYGFDSISMFMFWFLPWIREDLELNTLGGNQELIMEFLEKVS